MTSKKFDLKSAFEARLKDPEMGDIIEMAAVTTLMDYLFQDTSTTTIQEFIDNMQAAQTEICKHTSSIAARTTCELFIKYVTFAHQDLEGAADFQECKKILIQEGDKFRNRIRQNISTVVKKGVGVIREGMVILTHSRSKLVLRLMESAHKSGKKFTVYVTDGQPSGQGKRMVQELQGMGIEAKFIYDTEVAFKMESVDSVVVGAEGVNEDGGALCQIGFYNIALIAKAYKRQVQVLVESHKFSRLCILTNSRLPKDILYDPKLATEKDQSPQHPLIDFTPAKYINEIITDFGVLPTSAVCEYLLDLYT